LVDLDHPPTWESQEGWDQVEKAAARLLDEIDRGLAVTKGPDLGPQKKQTHG
jgi:hypothetical protein